MNYFILAKIGNVNMKKTFQKTLIAAAAGVALMSAVGTASANSLLFPYFTTATGAQSVLSLTNTTGTAQSLHYVYNYGTACTHYDAYGSLTQNDILTHSIAAPTAAAKGFGLAVPGDTSAPVYFPLADQVGFLVVSTKSAGSNAQGLQGSMAIVDPASGLVVSYPGISNGLATDVAANEGNFAAITDVNFALATLPAAVASTSWYGVVAGDMSTAIAAGADWPATTTFTNNGNVYNNDEVAFSGTVTKKITCAGSFEAKNLMTGAQEAAVGTNGGLVKATAGTFTAGGTGVVLMKMQKVQTQVGAPFGGTQFLHREAAGSF
jgi:hypothetical protein